MYLEKWKHGISVKKTVSDEIYTGRIKVKTDGMEHWSSREYYERISIFRYWYLSVYHWILQQWFPHILEEKHKESWRESNWGTTNPLGRTYWQYYKRNYLVVLLFTVGIILWSLFDYWRAGDALDNTFWWIMGALTALNIFVLWFSHYQYIRRI